MLASKPSGMALAPAIQAVFAAVLALAIRRRGKILLAARKHDLELKRLERDAIKRQPTRLFLVRHAERLDHASPSWAAHAARSHDSPLSEIGFGQARRSGEFLQKRGVGNDAMLYIRSSPLIRCVQTAACLTEKMGVPSLPVQIDDALCELERFLRPRMMGTHRLSVPPADKRTGVAPTCDAPRGVCHPVLLRPGDLAAIHPHVDLEYRGTVCPVDYDPKTGVELDALTQQPLSHHERAKRIVDNMAAIVPPGSTTILVTHGAFAAMLARLLLGETVDVERFGYAEVAELVCATGEDDCGEGQWRLVGERYAPAGDAGRHQVVC